MSLAIGLAVGPVHIGVGEILRSVLSYVPFLHVSQPLGAVDHAVLWEVRAPRVTLAALVGGMLAVAGASYQGVFRECSWIPDRASFSLRLIRPLGGIASLPGMTSKLLNGFRSYHARFLALKGLSVID